MTDQRDKTILSSVRIRGRLVAPEPPTVSPDSIAPGKGRGRNTLWWITAIVGPVIVGTYFAAAALFIFIGPSILEELGLLEPPAQPKLEEGSGNNLVQTQWEWEGTFDQYSYKAYPMTLHIDEVEGQQFSGKLYWPEFNSVTAFSGEVVTEFSDYNEQQRWLLVNRNLEDAEGTWLKFTEVEEIREGTSLFWTLDLNGWYYAYLTEGGVMWGFYFLLYGGSEPSGEFTLTISQ